MFFDRFFDKTWRIIPILKIRDDSYFIVLQYPLGNTKNAKPLTFVCFFSSFYQRKLDPLLCNFVSSNNN
jgi:hypothetical protein